MKEFELIRRFVRCETKLKSMGYSISIIDGGANGGFYIHNKKGTIVGDTTTVDGIYGFMQGLEYMTYDAQRTD